MEVFIGTATFSGINTNEVFTTGKTNIGAIDITLLNINSSSTFGLNVSSDFNIGTLTLDNVVNINMNGSKLTIGTLLTRNNSPFVFNLVQSSAEVRVITQVGGGSQVDNITWSLNYSSLMLMNVNHNGALNRPYIIADNSSNVNLSTSTIINTNNIIIALLTGSWMSVDDLTVTGCSRFVLGTNFRSALMNAVTTGGFPTIGNTIDMTGGNVSISGCTLNSGVGVNTAVFLSCPSVEINNSNFTSIGDGIVDVTNGRIYIIDSTLNGSTVVGFNAQNSDVTLITTNITTTSGTSFQGANSNVSMTSLSVTGATISETIFDNCRVTLSSLQINTTSASAINARSNSNITINGCTIVGGTTSGIIIDDSRFLVSLTSVNSAQNGVLIITQSKGRLNNVSGTNTLVGVDLRSGSSFSNALNNTITGGSGNVRVGNIGIQTWTNINTQNTTFTTDFFANPSQFVTISS